jgi:hypothetical protein
MKIPLHNPQFTRTVAVVVERIFWEKQKLKILSENFLIRNAHKWNELSTKRNTRASLKMWKSLENTKAEMKKIKISRRDGIFIYFFLFCWNQREKSLILNLLIAARISLLFEHSVSMSGCLPASACVSLIFTQYSLLALHYDMSQFVA